MTRQKTESSFGPWLFLCLSSFLLLSAKFTLSHLNSVVTASEYELGASGFVRWCEANNTICKKTEVDGRDGEASCPNSSQTVLEIYIHAGDGQTVYLLPDEKYSSTIEQSVVKINVISGHDLSWIAVVCGQITPTPSLTATPTSSPTPTPTATPSPTSSPSPTPTATSTPSPTPTDYYDDEPSPSPTPTLTPSPSRIPASSLTPSPTSSPSPTSTPTASPTLTVTPLLSPTTTVTPSPSPSVTPTPSPEPGPTSTSQPGPTSTPAPNVGGGESPTSTPNPLNQGIVNTISVADTSNPLVDGIRESFYGQVLGLSFPATDSADSSPNLPSGNKPLDGHFIVIPKLKLIQPVYRGESVGQTHLVGNQEIDFSRINGADVLYGHGLDGGIFQHLYKLTLGDEVSLFDQDGQNHYQVTDVRLVDASDVSAVNHQAGLVYLLTCTSQSQRLLITAKIIK